MAIRAQLQRQRLPKCGVKAGDEDILNRGDFAGHKSLLA
jgi:hypothetical protein